MADSRPVKTPMESGVRFNVPGPTEVQVDPTDYQTTIGCLLWLSMGTRPGIAQAVATLVRFVTNPGDAH